MRIRNTPGHYQRVYSGAVTIDPAELSQVVIPQVPYHGSSRLGKLSVQQTSVTGAGAAVAFNTTPVPSDRVRYVHMAEFRTDGTVNLTLKLYLGIPTTAPPASDHLVQLAYQLNDANEVAAIPRTPFYMPPLTYLRGVTVSGLSAGKKAVITVLYADLPIGETVQL